MGGRLMVMIAAACVLGCGRPQAKVESPKIELEANVERRLHGVGFALAPDSATIVVSHGSQITLLELEEGRLRRHNLDGYAADDLAFSPDGQWLAAQEVRTSESSRIFLFIRSGANEFEAPAGLFGVCHEMYGSTIGLRFSGDSKHIASPGGDGYFLWSVPGCDPEKSRELGAADRDWREGLQRSEDLKTLSYSRGGSAWSFKSEKRISQDFGFVNDRIVVAFTIEDGYRSTKRALHLIDGRDGKVLLRLGLDAAEGELEASTQVVEALRPSRRPSEVTSGY